MSVLLIELWKLIDSHFKLIKPGTQGYLLVFYKLEIHKFWEIKLFPIVLSLYFLDQTNIRKISSIWKLFLCLVLVYCFRCNNLINYVSYSFAHSLYVKIFIISTWTVQIRIYFPPISSNCRSWGASV